MKLIIQIPCLNEEKTLPITLKDLPQNIKGIDTIEYLIIDDGSTDNTIEVAKNAGVHHILKLGSNRGLAYAFAAGLDYCLKAGADIVVNTDGDNQYNGGDIDKLIQPILQKSADIVVGARPILKHKEFSMIKKFFQIVGSKVLRHISRTKVKDAPSGFRAFSREACFQLNLYTKCSYAWETLIQAGNSNLRVESVDIWVNPKTRESRLFRNIFEHIWKSAYTMFNMFLLYRPGRFFFFVGSIFNVIALIIGIRFIILVYFLPEPGRTHIPSLILLAIFSFIGLFTYFLGIIGELIKYSRKLNEKINYNLKKSLYKN